jgi:hypothetical protein
MYSVMHVFFNYIEHGIDLLLNISISKKKINDKVS